MDKLYKYAQHFTKLELMKASLCKLGTGSLEVFENEMKHSEIRPNLKKQLTPGQSGREGVDFIINPYKYLYSVVGLN
ncbi:MAG: hypothetical protein H6587_10970 [Flavobacteriales bacterium]|nr:hypothetical protein [Flavobacteriales bacterium]MCB9365080.1 hypothetical protein [Flavobacteriales bacterium]